MIHGGLAAARGSRPTRIQSRSCIKLNINNSGLWSDSRGERASSALAERLYPPISIFSSATRRGTIIHRPPRPWTRLHLISGIVLNHHGSQGLASPRRGYDRSLPFHRATYARPRGVYYWFSIGIEDSALFQRERDRELFFSYAF